MSKSFVLRAPTVDGGWHSFYIDDCPVKITDNTFVLLNQPGSPIMYCDVYRGDSESGLFEGDVIYADDTEWLVCYDRGFYVINEDYGVKYLYQLKDFKVLGINQHDVKFPIPSTRRKKHVFRYKDVTFSIWGCRLRDEDGLHVMNYKDPIDPDLVCQEACATYKGERMFIGNTYGGSVLSLHGGRLAYVKDGAYYDITDGGELVGYIPDASKRA